MKLKHTLNGNVKLTLSAEEAGHLRSILVEACPLYAEAWISDVTHDVAHEVDDLLAESGIELLI